MLARSTRDLGNTLDAIAKAGAGFRSLGDTWADTTTPDGRLKLTVLGGLAERELIRTHGRRSHARQDARREDGASPEAHRAPEARSDPAARSWREDACGDWPQL
jgi:DNA invertase Pin-like site-specific DNA recombinase